MAGIKQFRCSTEAKIIAGPSFTLMLACARGGSTMYLVPLLMNHSVPSLFVLSIRIPGMEEGDLGFK